METPARVDSVSNSFMRKKGWFLLGVLVVAVYFGYFALPGLSARFSGDDPMNIHYTWSHGGWALLKGLVLFFTPYHRPMGGLFFFSLYKFFGLNPLSYHIAITVVLLINVVLAYRCAVLLSGSRIVGGLCSIFACYHANMPQAVFLPAFIFDALCFMFFFAALAYYLRIRSAGRLLGIKELVLFLLLYVAALESKEMAVTLPMMLLAYEIFDHPPAWSPKSLWIWVRSAAFPLLAAAFLTAVYAAGKLLSSEPLSQNPQYQLTISLQTFLQSEARFFKELFYLKPHGWFNEQWLILIWLLLAYIAYRRRENYLKWATLLTVIAPLPIAFIPGRGGICLWVPWFGWALWLAALSATFSRFVSKEPLLRRLPRSLAQAIPLLLIVALVWNHTDRHNRLNFSSYSKVDEYSFSLKEQLGILLPRVKPRAQIAFYSDGAEGYDAKFVTELFFHDQSVRVRLHAKEPLSPEEFDRTDYVLNFDQRKLAILKRPGEPFRAPVNLR